MTIGERIKQRRIELNLSQDELAQKVGYKSRSSINKIELSRSLPLSKVQKMADALETTPAFLMGWKELPDTMVAHLKPKIEPTDEEIDMLIELRVLDKSFNKAIRASIASAYADFLETHKYDFNNVVMMDEDEHKNIH